MADNKKDDPLWFYGISDKNIESKREYMRRKVKSRLEGSVFNTRFKKQLEKKRLSKREHVILKRLFDEVKKDLKRSRTI